MMASPSSSVRHRGSKKNADRSPSPAAVPALKSAEKQPAVAKGDDESWEWDYRIALVIVTIGAFVSRFWKISHPDQVVFDEVHFGKFASLYIQGTYFFDVHPPFAKLLFALVGWLVGFDGKFLFENIGDSYIDNKVPYVALRALPATLGSLTVPVVFLIMWESGYSLPACILSASLLLFDNAHIGEDRLILLDATLVISMALSVLCYIKFHKNRHEPFGRKWWKWLILTGIALSCVISTKYVGVFTFVTIGSAVLIDLWNLLDVNRRQGKLTLFEFGTHFAARAFGLIVVPFFLYLFWFQVHFAILTKSGPGDDFMSPEFQASLSDNPMFAQSKGIEFHDVITIRHKDTKVYLHSHLDRYPLRYDDGRVSSQGQQVTGYPHNDTNNHWEIIPEFAFSAENRTGHKVRNGNLIQLRHVATNSFLLSHDVASPSYPTNQEFTTISPEDAAGKRRNDTLFEIQIPKGKSQEEFRTRSSLFSLIHFPSKVAMWTHTKPLPDWGYKQAEINGNKNNKEASNLWYAEDIPSLAPDSPRMNQEPRKVQPMRFLKKYLELQIAMFHHNNALTSSHPYASEPFQWPFLLRGVSFWTKNDTREQIYFLGNPVGWWLSSSLLAVFVGIIGADQLSLRRGIDALEEIWGPGTRNRLYNSTGFFFLCWAAHYFPFYLMGRQRFLHHYLPAHVASVLVTGALVEFVFNLDPAGLSENSTGRKPGGKPQKLKHTRQSLMAIWAATIAILGATIWGFGFFAPLTYGTPGLDVAGINARKWLSYDLHFAK